MKGTAAEWANLVGEIKRLGAEFDKSLRKVKRRDAEFEKWLRKRKTNKRPKPGSLVEHDHSSIDTLAIPPNGPTIFYITFNRLNLAEALIKYRLENLAIDEQEMNEFMELAISKYGEVHREELEKVVLEGHKEVIKNHAGLVAAHVSGHFRKLFSALVDLVLRAAFFSARPSIYGQGHDHFKSMGADEFKEIVQDYISSVKEAFPVRGRGGATRKSDYPASVEQCKKFAHLAEKLYPLWEFITKFFEDNEYEAECSSWVKGHSQFKLLSKDCNEVPKALFSLVFRRQENKTRENSPLGLALQHAGLVLGSNKGHEALRKDYYDGGGTISSDNSENSPKSSKKLHKKRRTR